MSDGCDCTELCSMGPTCPGGMLAGLPGSGCWHAALTTCPTCGGAGIVDTSPPGVDRHPWLATDIDCPRCLGEGVIDDNDIDIEESTP